MSDVFGYYITPYLRVTWNFVKQNRNNKNTYSSACYCIPNWFFRDFCLFSFRCAGVGLTWFALNCHESKLIRNTPATEILYRIVEQLRGRDFRGSWRLVAGANLITFELIWLNWTGERHLEPVSWPFKSAEFWYHYRDSYFTIFSFLNSSIGMFVELRCLADCTWYFDPTSWIQ